MINENILSPAERIDNINNIMLVDDDQMQLKLIGFMLIKEKFDVVCTVTNGQDAIKIYENIKDSIDLVILDLFMPPGINGIHVLEKILLINPLANIIMCSGIGEENIMKQALLRGAKAFVNKPVIRDKLFQAIDNIQNPQSEQD